MMCSLLYLCCFKLAHFSPLCLQFPRLYTAEILSTLQTTDRAQLLTGRRADPVPRNPISTQTKHRLRWTLSTFF